MNEAQRRGYKKVRITEGVGGWPVGSIAWHDGHRWAYNDDCSAFWCHTVGASCEYVEDEKMKIEAGKYYKTRDGQVVGPMMKYDWHDANDDKAFIVEVGDGMVWSTGGVAYGGTYDHLIEPAYPEQGTLKEIGAKPGDVVEFISHPLEYKMHEVGMRHYIAEDGKAWDQETYDGQYWEPCSRAVFRIISRASDKPTSPVRTVTTTRKEVVPGVYGCLTIRETDELGPVQLEINGTIGRTWFNKDDIDGLIATLTEIRNALT